MNKNRLFYKNGSVYFTFDELAKIESKVPKFSRKTHFDICDLQMYDQKIFEKIKDESLYKQIADIQLHSMVHLYGGENVRIYKSTQDNGHYIYWRYCWGD